MKKLLCVLAVLCTVAVFGCTKKSAGKDYDLYLFNAKGENAAQVEAMAKAYGAETGVKVKTFSIGAGAEQQEPMNAEMNSKNPPGIYSIQGIKNLDMWLTGGFVVDLATVTDPAFAKLVADIPEGLRMSLGGNTSYGIPYNIEGYGFIVDKQMLADLFGAENAGKALAGLQQANWQEWQAFVLALEKWIAAPQAASVTLGGNSFTFAAAKTPLTSKLTGVFAVMGAENWTYGDHYINIPLNAVFNNQMEALNVTEEKLQQLRAPLIEYAKALEFKTAHVAGKNGKVERGQDLVSPANFGYDQTVQIFADGKALFLKQGNWAYNNIANVDKAMAERLWFVPIKMPFVQSDITAAGMTVEKLNTSIPVFVPNYYAVNAMVSPEEQKAAYDFLVWMNTSPAGQKFIIEEMAFIPYNADPATTVVPNSLGNSIIDYMKNGKTLQGIFLAAPQVWPGAIVGQFLREQYLTKPVWDDADYGRIADYAIDEWRKISITK
ncbi:MAG: ABC transporter substrate-binding protein [Spirochaetaceae bacterium]|jgi:raffinose/stachyose/melibiose transport system substrate-binding protein|nr:ABC transporter substrate-binding protein [Spirochaetaceae bacterium]